MQSLPPPVTPTRITMKNAKVVTDPHCLTASHYKRRVVASAEVSHKPGGDSDRIVLLRSETCPMYERISPAPPKSPSSSGAAYHRHNSASLTLVQGLSKGNTGHNITSRKDRHTTDNRGDSFLTVEDIPECAKDFTGVYRGLESIFGILGFVRTRTNRLSMVPRPPLDKMRSIKERRC